MALGRPNIYPGHPGWDYPLHNLEQAQSRAYAKGCQDTRNELWQLLSKTKGMSPEARLSACIAWAGESPEDMANLIRGEE